MSESREGEQLSSGQEYLQSQYRDASLVNDRFAMYSLEECREDRLPFDPDLEVVKILTQLNMPYNATILDMGTSDTHFMDLLWLHGYKDLVIGIDPNSSQFEIDRPWLGGTEGFAGRKLLIRANANQVPLRSRSLDIYTAQNMWYLLKRRNEAFLEAKRLIKDSGIFILTTSGKQNKNEHRDAEEEIASYISETANTLTLAPPKMNEGFTTEAGIEELPTHFKYVYLQNHEAHLLIRDDYSKEKYRRSQYSMHDQYNPIPDRGIFEEAVEAIAIASIGSEGKRIRVSRSVFVCSDRELGLDPAIYQQITK